MTVNERMFGESPEPIKIDGLTAWEILGKIDDLRLKGYRDLRLHAGRLSEPLEIPGPDGDPPSLVWDVPAGVYLFGVPVV